MTYARRTDTTHAPIRDALREIGASVIDLHAAGGGCPDLLVGYRSRTFAVECKTLRKQGGKQTETTQQKRLRSEWRGDLWLIVYSPHDAVEVVTKAVL